MRNTGEIPEITREEATTRGKWYDYALGGAIVLFFFFLIWLMRIAPTPLLAKTLAEIPPKQTATPPFVTPAIVRETFCFPIPTLEGYLVEIKGKTFLVVTYQKTLEGRSGGGVSVTEWR